MATINGTPPIDYPEVEIAGIRYRVKFGLGALYRLEKFGLSAENIGATIEKAASEGKNLMVVFAILAATLGREDAVGSWIPIGLTPEELADKIPPEKLQELTAAITQAAGKVSPAETTGATPPAPPLPQ